MSQINLSNSEKVESVPGIFGIRLGDQPTYEVISNEGPIEIRYYDPQTLISVNTEKNHEDASLLLTQYIYGHNKESKSLAEPLSNLKDESMTSFFMTAPLLHTKINDKHTLSFVLPQEYSVSTAPLPLDSRIYFQEKSAHLKAVIKISNNTVFDHDQSAYDLLEWIYNHSSYAQSGHLQTAQYNSSGSMSFLRRNEVLIEITEKQ
jgi:hypothetical protein